MDKGVFFVVELHCTPKKRKEKNREIWGEGITLGIPNAIRELRRSDKDAIGEALVLFEAPFHARITVIHIVPQIIHLLESVAGS